MSVLEIWLDDKTWYQKKKCIFTPVIGKALRMTMNIRISHTVSMEICTLQAVTQMTALFVTLPPAG